MRTLFWLRVMSWGYAFARFLRRGGALLRRGASRARSGGFTLIELVAVVAIVLVLVSLLLTGITRAMQRVGLVNCQNNLRVMSNAIHQYAARHSGIMPQFSEYVWAGQVGLLSGGCYGWKLGSEYKYDIQTKYNLDPRGSYNLIFPRDPTETRLFRCPSGEPSPENPQGIKSNYTGLAIRDYVTIDTVERPSAALILVEYEPSPGSIIQADDGVTKYTNDSIQLPTNPQAPIERYRVAANHQRGGNIVFLDQHMEFAEGDGLEIQTWETAYKTTSTTSTSSQAVTTSTTSTSIRMAGSTTVSSSSTMFGGGGCTTSTTSSSVSTTTSTTSTSSTSTTLPRYWGPPGGMK